MRTGDLMRAAASLATVLVLSACGSSTPGVDASDEVDEVDEVGGFDAVSTDAESSGDVADAADAETDTARPVTPDDLCRSDDDCPSGERCRFVEPDAPVGLCTTGCASDADCPPGWGCFEFIEGDGDSIRVCVSERLCLDEDADGFGWGDDCRGLDCDDTRDDVRPDADEICNGRDDDCDGEVDGVTVDDGAPCVTGVGGACDPGVSACVDGIVSCAATAATLEVCNGVDDDCDGTADDGLDCAGEPCCFDDDCDGVCGAALTDETGACAPPAAFGDEVCDDRDNDCDGEVDEGFERRALYVDADGDGYGDETADPYVTCTSPDGFVENADDCDDTTDEVRPLIAEQIDNGIDDNCDGGELCYVDADDDGVVADRSFVGSHDLDCEDPGEGTADMPCCDCNDSDPTRSEGSDEICDAFDNDCDGAVDEGFERRAFYPDSDGDGFGDADAELLWSCAEPDGFVANNDDCDDSDRAVNPRAGEQYDNGVDNDCDGFEYCLADRDNDGVVVSTLTGDFVVSDDLDCEDPGEGRNPSLSDDTCCDCDDDDASVGAGPEEICDGVDNDCNGLVDEPRRGPACCCVDGRCYRADGVLANSEACEGGARVCVPGGDATEVASCDE